MAANNDFRFRFTHIVQFFGAWLRMNQRKRENKFKNNVDEYEHEFHTLRGRPLVQRLSRCRCLSQERNSRFDVSMIRLVNDWYASANTSEGFRRPDRLRI